MRTLGATSSHWVESVSLPRAVCAAFSGQRRLAFLNTTPDEVIRSLFFNKANQSLITVSVYRADNFSSLKCRTTPIEYIIRGQPDAGFALFESECLRWPGFVEFDDVNGKVLTYSAQDKAYRVWEMTNYELLFTLPDDDIHEIKISPVCALHHRCQSRCTADAGAVCAVQTCVPKGCHARAHFVPPT